MTSHIPVMLTETLHYLKLKKDGVYIDGTFGGGGHSRPILEKLANGKLIAFDCDEKALNSNVINHSSLILINDNFANLEAHLQKLNFCLVDGFLFDLGLSSFQLIDDQCGFSYRQDAPLDMRMDNRNKIKAEDIINDYSCEELADIFYYYGEERKARVIARKICERRQKEKITSTQQLVSIIASCFIKSKKKHPARKAFQALRIAVNDELENLKVGLKSALKSLAPGGRIVVISYHSLEDRIVKQTFKEYSGDKEKFCLITKKPLMPTLEEIIINNRARSAKMRIIEKKL